MNVSKIKVTEKDVEKALANIPYRHTKCCSLCGDTGYIVSHCPNKLERVAANLKAGVTRMMAKYEQIIKDSLNEDKKK